MKNNGIVIVATNLHRYYQSAHLLAESIKDYCPDFNVTLFTEDQWLDRRVKVFDNVVTDIPKHEDSVVNKRTKMWGMGNSPYETTLYLDADMEVLSEEFSTVFDQIKDNDMLWTEITKEREYAFVGREFGEVTFKFHGGVCLFKDTAKPFMRDWYDLWVKQATNEWWPIGNYPKKSLQGFDQFSLWWLINKEWDKYKYLKYDFFEDDHRWNAIRSYDKNLGHGVNPIIGHWLLGQEPHDED